MRMLILGASGFIGAHLTRYVASAGHDVVALCRSGRVAGFSGTCLRWSFGEPLTTSAMEGVSCAIHLAHDFNGTDGARQTLKGTLANVSQLRATGVERQIFFSSYSAGEHATSLYGRTKLMIEIGLGAADDIVIVRPGLVLGDGGIYGRIRKWARRLPVIPLPDGGYGQVPVIDVARLCRATLLIVEAAAPDRECNLFERQPLILRQLVLDAAAKVGRKPWIVTVPTSLIILGLRFATAMRLPFPVNADNLEGFMANQVARHKSTLQD
jgi:nucleoside-diphosphate-sugar epimerase